MLKVGRFKCQRGISLVELMVGIAISLVLLAGIITVMVRVGIAGGETVQAARLNQQLRSSLDQIGKELQRAGYVRWDGEESWEWENGVPIADPYTADAAEGGSTYNALDFYVAVAPQLSAMGDITIDGNCLLFTYDANGDGAQSNGNFENFGFRLMDGAVQRRTTGTDSHACDTGGWADITDANVIITALSFNLNVVSADNAVDGDSARYQYQIPVQGSPVNEWTDATRVACTPSVAGAILDYGDTLCLMRRSVAITLEGRLADDAGVTMALAGMVKIQNDHLQAR